jgi:hypothetical protein
MSAYQKLVPLIQRRLELHHQLYSGQCKAELWEEKSAWALRQAGFGSDWKPDFNHAVGVDQHTDSGVAISNKGGKMNANNTLMTISGSRLTKHKTIQEKLEFLKSKPEQLVFCLATNNKEWQQDLKRYYFVVVDAKKLDYHNQEWVPTYPQKGGDTPNGYKCDAGKFRAKISKSMSDQIWTDISSELFEEFYQIDVETQPIL